MSSLGRFGFSGGTLLHGVSKYIAEELHYRAFVGLGANEKSRESPLCMNLFVLCVELYFTPRIRCRGGELYCVSIVSPKKFAYAASTLK